MRSTLPIFKRSSKFLSKKNTLSPMDAIKRGLLDGAFYFWDRFNVICIVYFNIKIMRMKC